MPFKKLCILELSTALTTSAMSFILVGFFVGLIVWFFLPFFLAMFTSVLFDFYDFCHYLFQNLNLVLCWP